MNGITKYTGIKCNRCPLMQMRGGKAEDDD